MDFSTDALKRTPGTREDLSVTTDRKHLERLIISNMGKISIISVL